MRRRKFGFVLLLCMMALFILIRITLLKVDDKPKVIVVLKQMNVEYWKIIEAGAKKAFDDFNIDGEVIAPDSENSSTEQITLLKNVLKRHPDALIVAPTEPSATIPVLKEYHDKNIPTLMIDTDAKWENQTTYIGTDHYELGKMAGALLGSMLQPREQVAFICGMSISSVTNERTNGARVALEAIGVEIVTEQVGYDQNGTVKPVIENILKKHPNIQGVFATDDVMAQHALRIIKEKDLKKVPVIGTDGTIDILRFIESEVMGATVAQNPYDIGYISVEQALKAINGEHVEKRIDSGVDILTVDNARDRMNFQSNILKVKGNSLSYGMPPNLKIDYTN